MIMTEENPVSVKLPMSLVLKLATHPFEYAKVLIQVRKRLQIETKL